MKKYKFLKLLTLSILTLVSCDNYDFGDLDVNPNVPSSANPQALFSTALTNTRSNFRTTPTLYVQYLSETQYTEASLYQQNPSDFSGFYTGTIAELQAAINLNTNEKTKEDVTKYGSNANQIAVLEIYKAFVYAQITDVWGDIPYTQAIDASIIAPVYDDQETIYKGILSSLKAAEASLDVNAPSMNDLLLKGNVRGWKKFANSLRMVYSLRLSKKFPSNSGYAAGEFSAAFNDSDGYIATNADNVAYPSNENYKNGWWNTFNGRDDYAMSNTFINKLNELGDKRVQYYATPTPTTGAYIGLPYGWDRPKTIAWTGVNEYSLFGTALKQDTTPERLMTATQVNFAIAEAISRGWVSGSAKTFYNAAITQSFLMSGLSVADATAYIANPKVNFDPAKDIEMIATQRWIGLFPNGLEAWSSWRRTGFPVLTPAVDAINDSKKIPLRYLYPSDEANVNGANLSAAIAKLPGGDKGSSAIWWAR